MRRRLPCARRPRRSGSNCGDDVIKWRCGDQARPVRARKLPDFGSPAGTSRANMTLLVSGTASKEYVLTGRDGGGGIHPYHLKQENSLVSAKSGIHGKVL